jgi:hypothetical protein
MRHKTQHKAEGQSIVEMALLMPFLLMVLFGIIEFGYYIYNFSTVYQAARNGAEVAAGAPPHPEYVSPVRTPPYIQDDETDCIDSIIAASLDTFALEDENTLEREQVTITYPEYAYDPTSDPDSPEFLSPNNRRRIGYPIEVTVEYQIEPLTPLWHFVPLGNSGVMTVTATTRRSIEAFDRDPSNPNLSSCKPWIDP